jgi:hypothetical protein
MVAEFILFVVGWKEEEKEEEEKKDVNIQNI